MSDKPASKLAALQTKVKSKVQSLLHKNKDASSGGAAKETTTTASKEAANAPTPTADAQPSHLPGAVLKKMSTTHGTLAVSVSTPPATSASEAGIAIVLIHGNSSSSRIFRPIFSSSAFNQKHTLIALDLPGHGDSSDVPAGADVEKSYTQPGYADAVAQVVRALEVSEFVVLGWSLGGHIGLELIPLLGARAVAGEAADVRPKVDELPASTVGKPSTTGPILRGVMLVGSPHVPRGRTDLGFHGDVTSLASAREKLSAEEEEAFAKGGTGEKNYEPWMLESVKRTDGRAREIMFRQFREGSSGVDQKELVDTQEDVLLAFVNGAAEPLVKIDWIGENLGNAKRLWRGKQVLIEGSEHAPFWDNWKEFEPVFKEYVEDVQKAVI